MGPIQAARMTVIWFVLFTLCFAQTADAAGKKVVCYWQSWQHNTSSPHAYTADDIPVHFCTHVVFSYAKLDNRASSLHLGKEFDAGTDGYFRFFRLKERNPKVKLLLALGDRYGSDRAAWYEAIHDPPRRFQVVGMLYRLLKEYKFDGVHIDWKNAVTNEDNSTQNGIVKFAWQVRKTFKRSANFTLSCTTVLPKGRGLQAVLRELVPKTNNDAVGDVLHPLRYVDTFHVSPVGYSAGRMSSNGANVSRSDRDTLYTSLSRAAIGDGLQYLFQAGLPYEKIVQGIPFYGLKVPESSERSEPSDQDIIPYYEICDLLRRGVPTKWDEEWKSSYLVLDNGVRLYYNDADSVRQKVIFARWAGLGGVAAWPVNMDNQVDLQKRKNDLLKGIIEGMNEEIGVESATQVTEASATPAREAIGGISVLSVEVTESSSVTEASSARSSMLDVTTEGAHSQSNHTSSKEIDLVTTQLSSTVSRKYMTVEVEKVTYGPTNSEPIFPPLNHTTATPNFDRELTSTGTEDPTHSRSNETMEPVTTEIPHSSSQITTMTEIAESNNYNTTNEFSPLNETPPTPNFEWEFTSTGTEAPSHNSSSDRMEPVTTEIPDISSRNNPTTEVVESSNYNTTDEFHPLNQTTTTPNFDWELTSTVTQGPTRNSSSDAMEPVTTEIPDDWSRVNTTTAIAKSNNYNTTNEFSPLNETPPTPNFGWEFTSTGTEAPSYNSSSDSMEPVATEIPDISSRNNPTTEVVESSNYNTTDEFYPLNQTTATPNSEWELTSTVTQAPTRKSSSETMEPVTTEIPDVPSRINTATDVAESTNYNITDEFSSLNQTTATPNFEWELTSMQTQAPIHNSSSETMEPVTTKIPDGPSLVITTTDVAESTNYNTTDEFSPLNQTTATPNFEWELTGTVTHAYTRNSSIETMEPVTTEIPDVPSRINTTTEVAESTNYHTTDELSPFSETTTTPNFEWELTSTGTETFTHIAPVSREMPGTSLHVSRTTELAEVNNYRTTEDDSYKTTPYTQLNVTPAGNTFSTESPIVLPSVSSTEREQLASSSTNTESPNVRGFVTPSSTSFSLISAEKKCEKLTVGTVAHESDGEFYYHCYHGIALLRKCARGSKFDAATGHCSVRITNRHDVSAVQASPISHHVVELLNKVVSGEVALGKTESVGVDVNIKFNVGARS